MITKLIPFLLSVAFASTENVLMTEVFEIKINPSMFNWSYEGIADQYVYQASLQNAPDLPKWITYIYSEHHNAGFLYGVPPHKMGMVTLEVVALNRKNYETRHYVLPIHITEKLNPARYEVQLKIDNLNVEDMFDFERMDRLKDVFRKRLWRESDDDLYVTFLASAIELGARLPLDPSEGDGVVLRLGSKAPLSQDLIELQEEVKPLWKVPSCPRDFKRTTVERFFREAGFALDWCAFRLLEDNSSAMQHSRTNVENHSNINKDQLIPNQWKSINIDDVPDRSYTRDFLFTILVPLFLMTLLALILSLVLCFHHEGMVDPLSEDYFDNIFHICTDYLYSSKILESAPEDEMNQFATIQKATQSLRNFSTSRDFSCLSPESVHIARNYSESPTNTINKGIHCRPSPPPYIRPKYKPDF